MSPGSDVAQRLYSVPGALWERARQAPRRLLMLDYDGTLAPLRAERERALPFAGAAQLLAGIAGGGGTTVAVISGRRLQDLERLMAPEAVHLFAEHGWDRRLPDGRLVRHALRPEAEAALQQAAEEASGWEERIERKRCSIVLHTRGMAESAASEIEASCAGAWERLQGAGLRVCRIDGGVELRAAGHDKGSAVLELLAESPSATLPVYVGDDATDEDAFREVRAAGFGLRVGARERRSVAAGRLGGCREVAAFLEEWLAKVEHRPVRPDAPGGASGARRRA